MKKVSIIVGIYNSGRFLRKGLESLRKQTWSNIEILLMDDGSFDDSGEICDEYTHIDKRFTVIHKDNMGVCDSRNKGIELATGDYICFMDGDDWLAVDFVEYMMGIIEKTHTYMALSDNLFTTYDREQIEEDNIEIWNDEKTITNIIYPYMMLGPWNKLYSMRIINEHNIRFPSHWFGETLHFASTVAYYSKNVGVGHRKVYNYRLDNENSGTAQYNVKTRLLSLDNAINLQYAVFSKNEKIMKAVKWHLHACYFTLIVNIIGCNSEQQYKEEYSQAIKYLRKNGLKVFWESEVNIREKIKILAKTFFARLYAKRYVKRQNSKLNLNYSRNSI